MSLVLDTSITAAWCFKDESTPQTQDLLHTVLRNGAVVPSLWRLEIANVLQTGVRRKRITSKQRDESLTDLSLLPISIDHDVDTHAWTTTLQLADRYALTIYDACYLELAQRLNLPLATLDQELAAAGHALGLPPLRL